METKSTYTSNKSTKTHNQNHKEEEEEDEGEEELWDFKKLWKDYSDKWLKKGPGELLAVANDGSLQLGAVVPLEPHEIGDGIIV